MTDNADVPIGTEDDVALFDAVTSGEAPAHAEEAPNVADLPPVDPPKAEEPREDHRVPLSELRAEREKRQQYEREVGEIRARYAALEQHVVSMRQPQVQAPPPDIFENPNAFVEAQMQPALDQQRQAMLYNARLIAEARFGEENVNKAQEAFDALAASRQIHPAEHQQVMSSPNPFAEVVKWHQRHKTISEVGTDPAAFRERLKQELLNDPDFRKQADTQWRSQAQALSAPQQRGPVINLPSLSKVGSTALPSGQDGGADDGELFNAITSRKRR